jgi:hypothetical protein
MATTAQRDKTRLYIGDTNADRPLFNDNEIDLVIDDRGGDALQAAADCCDILATRFAREHDIEWQGSPNARTKLTRSQMSKAYSDRAVALRRRANGQVSTASTTRVDGFNEDIDSRAGAGQTPATGRVRAGYTNPDLPV